MTLKKDKYQEVILYLCQKLGGEIRGKKKLAKLLYFVDFDFYEKKDNPLRAIAILLFPWVHFQLPWRK